MQARNTIPRRTRATYSHVAANDVDRSNLVRLSRHQAAKIERATAAKRLADLQALKTTLAGI